MAIHLGFGSESEVGAKKRVKIDRGRVRVLQSLPRLPCGQASDRCEERVLPHRTVLETATSK